MKIITVESDHQLSQLEMKNIQDILRHSQCPHESLTNSIDGYRGFDGFTVIVGEGGAYKAHIEV